MFPSLMEIDALEDDIRKLKATLDESDKKPAKTVAATPARFDVSRFWNETHRGTSMVISSRPTQTTRYEQADKIDLETFWKS